MPLVKNFSMVYDFPLREEITCLKPVAWLNPDRADFQDLASLPIHFQDIMEASALWDRFAPFLATAFPETRKSNGIIESALKAIPNMQAALDERFGFNSEGKIFLKCDNDLPVCGSIKARGGMYEVLYHAEQLALKQGLISQNENYEAFASDRFRDFFSQYSIGVGSTGNLGLSIGIISARLGFQVSVYMSADAKEWKKKLLRTKGARVLEYSGDFSEAISEGRKATLGLPNGYFVDDEHSKHLFLGYSVAALRLKAQLDAMNIQVNAAHPLFVYSPCGVGGSPGGVAFGLRQVFGNHAHCFFVEPTHSPAVLLGLLTGKMQEVCVQDFGIDNRTEADGLAVGRPSAFATAISQRTISGAYTIEDDELFRLLFELAETEQIRLEPSATAGLIGPYRMRQTGYLRKQNINPDSVTHIAWATGGSLVPTQEMEGFMGKGRALLSPHIA